MDDRTIFMNNVLAQMNEYLSSEQIETLQHIMSKELCNMELIKRTQLTVRTDTMVNERLLKLFVASKRLEGTSESTLRHYTYEAKKLLTHINKILPDIATVDVQFYLSEYQVYSGCSRRTLDNTRRALSGLFLWLSENGYVTTNIMKPIKAISFEKKPIVILSEEEIYEIREEARSNLRTRAIVELLLSTGVRVSELCSIDIDDVDFKNNEIVIHSAKKRRKEDRILFLTVEAKKCMEDYLEYRTTLFSPDGPALFISNRNKGHRITERLVNTTLRSIEKKLGLSKKLTVHTFRRTLASRMYRKGIQPLMISKILGHADTRMSETYYIGVENENMKVEFFKYM